MQYCFDITLNNNICPDTFRKAEITKNSCHPKGSSCSLKLCCFANLNNYFHIAFRLLVGVSAVLILGNFDFVTVFVLDNDLINFLADVRSNRDGHFITRCRSFIVNNYIAAVGFRHRNFIQFGNVIGFNITTARAAAIYTKPNYVVQELDRILVDHAQLVIDKHKELAVSDGIEFNLIADIKNIHKNYAYLRYDYIGRKFMYYSAKEQCAKLNDEEAREFAYWMNTLEDHLFYEWVRGGMISVTGGYELNRWWFPYSKLYRSPGTTSEPKEDARAELLEYLQDNDYLDIPIDTTQQAAVMEEVLRLITKYGERTLGFKRGSPKTLGPALKKFTLNLKETKNHDNNDKIITVMKEEN